MTFSEAVFSIITQFLVVPKPSLAFLTTEPFRLHFALPFARFARPSFKSPHRLFPFNYGHPRPPFNSRHPPSLPVMPLLPPLHRVIRLFPTSILVTPRFPLFKSTHSPLSRSNRGIPRFPSSNRVTPRFPSSNRLIPRFPGQSESFSAFPVNSSHSPLSPFQIESFPASPLQIESLPAFPSSNRVIPRFPSSNRTIPRFPLFKSSHAPLPS